MKTRSIATIIAILALAVSTAYPAPPVVFKKTVTRAVKDANLVLATQFDPFANASTTVEVPIKIPIGLSAFDIETVIRGTSANGEKNMGFVLGRRFTVYTNTIEAYLIVQAPDPLDPPLKVSDVEIAKVPNFNDAALVVRIKERKLYVQVTGSGYGQNTMLSWNVRTHLKANILTPEDTPK